MEPTEHTSRRESRVAVVLGTAGMPHLVRWSTILRPVRQNPFDSYALRTGAGWVLVDPEPPDAAGMARLEQLIQEEPAATVLTSDGHERACYTARERWGTPVWGPEVGPSERGVGYEGQPDHIYTEGTSLPGGLRAIRLAGAWGGDHALLWNAPGGERVLFTGDLLNGQVELDLAAADHHRRAPGLYFGARPAYAERHPDRAALAQSLRRLREENATLICGSHGAPFGGDVKGAIDALLATL